MSRVEQLMADISIHAPRKGVRPAVRRGKSQTSENFNPRTPQGGATYVATARKVVMFNFNPRTPQGGATLRRYIKCMLLTISIHAPRKGVRRRSHKDGGRVQIISIHAPHEGVRPICPCSFSAVEIFQSTHPTRGCDGQLLASFLHTRISIHAPHEGVRPVVLAPVYYLICPFQSTHPTRGCDCVLVLAAS